MVLYMIGLGLGDEKDITVRGLEIVRNCKKVFLEKYTSILQIPTERLTQFYGREVTEADREGVESQAEQILEPAKTEDVAFLVVGDVFGATTHSDLNMRAIEMGIQVKVIHNTSILNAVGCCGLQLYRFGEAVSIVFFTDTWKPDSFYDKIKHNKSIGLHTLLLHDIKVKEPSLEALARGKVVYEPPRYMTVNQCIEQLLEIEETRKENVYSKNSVFVGLARVGCEGQTIKVGTMEELLEEDFGTPLHCSILPGDIQEFEREFLSLFTLPNSVAFHSK